MTRKDAEGILDVVLGNERRFGEKDHTVKKLCETAIELYDENARLRDENSCVAKWMDDSHQLAIDNARLMEVVEAAKKAHGGYQGLDELRAALAKVETDETWKQDHHKQGHGGI